MDNHGAESNQPGTDVPLNLGPSSHGKTIGTRIAEFGLNIVMSLTLFAVFVAAFFFIVASQIEVVAVKRNTNRVITELMANLSQTLPVQHKAEIRNSLNEHLVLPDMSVEDKEVADKNKTLVEHTWIVLGSLFGVGVLLVLAVWGIMKWYAGPNGQPGTHYPNLKHLVLENLILLGFVGLTEFGFLLMVGAHFRSLDANRIRRNAMQTLRDFISG